MELGESCRKAGRRTEESKEDRDSTGSPTVSTNLDPWELSDMELSMKEYETPGIHV